MENFKLRRRIPPKPAKSERCVVRVSGDVYYLLAKASTETGAPISRIANAAINYAFDNVEYVDEGDRKGENI